MKRKAYAAVFVNEVSVAQCTHGREAQTVWVGLDIGKEDIFVVLRWAHNDISRPWRVSNPQELLLLVEKLKELSVGRQMHVGMEPTGTYGHPLRQALADAHIVVQRVSPKATHDYAEIYDGVPSQHDGKDAAVVAELLSLGKAHEWVWRGDDLFLQEMQHWVRRLELALRQEQMWTGHLEGAGATHWPELNREGGKSKWKWTSPVLLRVLSKYGGPREFAASTEAESELHRWSFGMWKPARIATMLQEARTSVGVRTDAFSREQLQWLASQALEAQRQRKEASKQLERLAQSHEVLRLQGAMLGGTTACVLWVHLGDPRAYEHAEQYRKAMGLNLRERSSGKYQGQLKLSKRGHPAVRRWLYFSAMRYVKSEPTRSWYQHKKLAMQSGKKALVAVMRKLALGVHQIGVQGQAFEASELFTAPTKPATPTTAKKRRRQRRRRTGKG